MHPLKWTVEICFESFWDLSYYKAGNQANVDGGGVECVLLLHAMVGGEGVYVKPIWQPTPHGLWPYFGAHTVAHGNTVKKIYLKCHLRASF